MIRYRTILFDIDDTLIDFKKSEKLSLDHVYTRFFFEAVSKEAFLNDYRKINHALWGQVEKGMICSSHVGSTRFQQLSELYQLPFSPDMSHDYEGQLILNSQWLPGAKDLLELLKKHRVPMGFISNGFAHIQRGKYQNLALYHYSDVLVISEEVGCAKPDSKIFHHTLNLLNATPSETLMIGDSLTSDGEGARRLEIPFCWYNPSGSSAPQNWQPDHTVSNLESISSLNFLC